MTTPACRVLGAIEVDAPTGPVRLRGQQAMLLAQIAAAYPRVASTSAIEHALWGEVAPPDGRGALQVAVTRLRKRMVTGEITFDGYGYRLVLPADQVDHVRFEDLVERAQVHQRDGDAQSALRCVAEAQRLWRGHPFASVADTMALESITSHLLELRAAASELEVEALLAIGDVERAVTKASRNVDDEPLREVRWIHLMRALHETGRSAEALRTFQQYRRMLVHDLGLEPGPPIVELEARILESTGPGDNGEPETGKSGASTFDLDVATMLDSASVVRSVPTSFVGRLDELERIGQAFERCRLVTLLGPPGVGKTRLALQHVRARPAGTVWWLDLSHERPGTVIAALAERLGLADEHDVARLAQSSGALLDVGEPMLVLDNCEHVIGAARQVATTLLEHLPGLSVLTTSQRPLGSPDEMLLTVEPLLVSAAAQLLRDRVGATASLDHDAAVAVVERADRLPLAIELIAPRLRMSTVAEVLAGDAPGPAPALSERLEQATRDLDELHRRVLWSCAVMAGPFDAAGAAAVADCDAAAARAALDELADRSLVVRDLSGAEPRCSLLETVRSEGLRQLGKAGDLEPVRRRHLAHHATLVGSRSAALFGLDEEFAVDAFAADSAQFRTAFEHACLVGDVDRAARLALGNWEWTQRGHRTRDFGWAERVTCFEGFDELPARVEVTGLASLGIWQGGGGFRAIDVGVRSHELAAVDGVPTSIKAHFALTAAYGAAGRYDAAFDEVRAAWSRAREDENRFEQVSALGGLTLAFALIGEADLATEQSDRALAIAAESANTSTLAYAHQAAGYARLDRRPDAALVYLREALRLAARVDNDWLVAWTSLPTAAALRRLGNVEESAATLAVAVRRWHGMAVNAGLFQSLLEAVLTLDAAGHRSAAIELMQVVGPTKATWPLMPADMLALSLMGVDEAVVSPLEDAHVAAALGALDLVAG